MSEVEKKILEAIEGVEFKEAYEALMLALHRLMGSMGFGELLTGRNYR